MGPKAPYGLDTAIHSENELQIVAYQMKSLSSEKSSSLTPTSSFIMATLALITDYITDAERNAVLNRYFDLFDTAILANNTTELGSLLSLAVYWNSDPTLRPRLVDAANKATSIEAHTLPEKRVNKIAAEIYQRLIKL